MYMLKGFYNVFTTAEDAVAAAEIGGIHGYLVVETLSAWTPDKGDFVALSVLWANHHKVSAIKVVRMKSGAQICEVRDWCELMFD